MSGTKHLRSLQGKYFGLFFSFLRRWNSFILISADISCFDGCVLIMILLKGAQSSKPFILGFCARGKNLLLAQRGEVQLGLLVSGEADQALIGSS